MAVFRIRGKVEGRSLTYHSFSEEPLIDKWRKQVKIFHVGIAACRKEAQGGSFTL